jgi:hypothetical protein
MLKEESENDSREPGDLTKNRQSAALNKNQLILFCGDDEEGR